MGLSNRTKKKWVVVPYPKSTTWEVVKGQRGIFLVGEALSGLSGLLLCQSGI